MNANTIADLQFLNLFKHRIRETTQLLDQTGIKKYVPSQEAYEVKHAVVILLAELQFHSLLPDGVTISSVSSQPNEQAEIS
jgi:hypothetical protein